MESLNAARDLRMKEIKMEALLKEIIIYAIFVTVVFFLSYQARDSDSFIFAENVKNTFFRNTPLFESVSTAYIWCDMMKSWLVTPYRISSCRKIVLVYVQGSKEKVNIVL